MSLRALRQAIGLMLGAGSFSSVQDMPSTPPTVKAPVGNVIVTVTPAPPPPLVALV